MNGFVIDCYLKNSIHKIFPNFPINSASNEQSVLEVIHFKNVTLVYSFALKRPKFMTISNFEILFTLLKWTPIMWWTILYIKYFKTKRLAGYHCSEFHKKIFHIAIKLRTAILSFGNFWCIPNLLEYFPIFRCHVQKVNWIKNFIISQVVWKENRFSSWFRPYNADRSILENKAWKKVEVHSIFSIFPCSAYNKPDKIKDFQLLLDNPS